MKIKAATLLIFISFGALADTLFNLTLLGNLAFAIVWLISFVLLILASDDTKVSSFSNYKTTSYDKKTFALTVLMLLACGWWFSAIILAVSIILFYIKFLTQKKQETK